eukprot:500967_1
MLPYLASGMLLSIFIVMMYNVVPIHTSSLLYFPDIAHPPRQSTTGLLSTAIDQRTLQARIAARYNLYKLPQSPPVRTNSVYPPQAPLTARLRSRTAEQPQLPYAQSFQGIPHCKQIKSIARGTYGHVYQVAMTNRPGTRQDAAL